MIHAQFTIRVKTYWYNLLYSSSRYQYLPAFKAGSTLREAISAHAQQEGMQVIWDLDQDFVIKHQFQLDTTIAAAVKQIASAVDSNFDGEVRGYVCPAQRTLVVTANHTEYLNTHCVVAQ